MFDDLDGFQDRLFAIDNGFLTFSIPDLEDISVRTISSYDTTLFAYNRYRKMISAPAHSQHSHLLSIRSMPMVPITSVR